jgi:hypothetical protein
MGTVDVLAVAIVHSDWTGNFRDRVRWPNFSTVETEVPVPKRFFFELTGDWRKRSNYYPRYFSIILELRREIHKFEFIWKTRVANASGMPNLFELCCEHTHGRLLTCARKIKFELKSQTYMYTPGSGSRILLNRVRIYQFFDRENRRGFRLDTARGVNAGDRLAE